MKLIKQSYFRDKHINYIINNFDYDRVHKVMNFLDWRWWGENQPPTIELMKEVNRKGLKEVWEECKKLKETVSISTGGYKYKGRYFKNGRIILEMSFIICNWTSYVEEENKIYNDEVDF